MWVHYYELENKAQSCQWVGPGSLRPKKFKMQPSAGKVMAAVFWDAQGVIMLDFLANKSTITGVYYANLHDQLRTAIREKRQGNLSKGILLQQDNARVHTCKMAMDAVERNGYELIPQPASSPDLAPSDSFLFPNLKKDIHGHHFRSNEEFVAAVGGCLENQKISKMVAFGNPIQLHGGCLENQKISKMVAFGNPIQLHGGCLENQFWNSSEWKGQLTDNLVGLIRVTCTYIKQKS